MHKSFYTDLHKWPPAYVKKKLSEISIKNIENTLSTASIKEQISPENFIALLSYNASMFLETLASIAQQYTLQHFGKTIQLFAPLYLSNFCINTCSYCSFNAKNPIKRIQLNPKEIHNEAINLSKTGLKHILLLTGDAPAKATTAYISEAASNLTSMFSSIGIEIYAETEKNYTILISSGVDSMTLFQETYNESIYKKLHGSGPKSNFLFRLDAQSRAASAGIRSVTIGALLGLDYWWRDVFYIGMHAAWLQKYHPGIEIAISVPRIRPHEGSFTHLHTVYDSNLVQAILALRIFLPTVGIILSTRESPKFRDNLIQLGITKMSAGVSTSVGGYSKNTTINTPQFEIADHRSVETVAKTIKNKGYQPIFKNWFLLDQPIKDTIHI